MIRLAAYLLVLTVAACGSQTDSAPPETGSRRIVSLDYCADQYVIALADRENIAALSPDATSSFSYLREEAEGLPQIRPRAEDILTMKPDIVVRTYGGGPAITGFLERAGIRVIQIGYAPDLEAVKSHIRETAAALDAETRGAALIRQMEARLAALPEQDQKRAIMYLTSRGATAGRGTMIDDLINTAGFRNFQETGGWASIPLEQLAYEQPRTIATGFFETGDLTSDIWTSARHPVVRRALANAEIVNLPGAWTACSGWFLMDAIEAMATLPAGAAND